MRNLLFDFTVDKENKTVNVKREFAAELSLVWDAWTTSDMLDKWWAPKPWRAQTKTMDFKTGGYWLYAMVGPENEMHWAKMDYEQVNKEKNYTGKDAFCNEEGKVNEQMPRSLWNVSFSGEGDATTVNILISFDDLASLEGLIEMGFKEGFTMGMENLDELLEKSSK